VIRRFENVERDRMFRKPVTVVRDIVIDSHIHGYVGRISPKEPVPVVAPAEEDRSPVSAANVATALAAVGWQVTLAGLIGTDTEANDPCETFCSKGVQWPHLTDCRRGREIVFISGCFAILRAGHLNFLQGAERLGDLLVVGLNSDASVRGLKGDSRPVISQENRASLLAGLAFLHFLVLFDDPTPDTLIKWLEPDVLVKEGDYKTHQIAGADYVADGAVR